MITQAAQKTKQMTIWRWALALILAAISGLMLLLSFPPYEIWWLAWIAFIPGLFSQHRLLPLKYAPVAPAVWMAVFLGPFLDRLFGSDFGPFFQYLGLLIGLLTYFLQTERRFHELTQYRWFVLQGVLAWVGFEMVRATFIPLIATSAFIGYTQATQPWLIQPVSVLSVYGLNLVIMLVNFALAQAVLVWYDRRWGKQGAPSPQSAARWLAAVLVVLAAWVGSSVYIRNTTHPHSQTVRVAALQPNLPLPAHQDEINTAQVRLDIITAMSREAASQGAEIIYTPEMVFNFDPQVEYTTELHSLAAETNAYLFLTYTVSREGQEWRNEAVLLTPQGEFLDVYGKNHVFGEPPTLTSGTFPVYDTPAGSLATLICHDANYTDIARKLAANGAQVIAAPFREFAGFGEQAWTHALFRAVENRTAVIVSGVATVSGIINPDGSIVALDYNIHGERLVQVGDVSLGAGDAPYTILGDILGWVSLAGFIFFTVYQFLVERGAKLAVKTSSTGSSGGKPLKPSPTSN